ncbi:MAG: nitrous oxide reductase family maturation protein NosD [Chrysiogenetes bacterium]|nr:nitrous oxide reductase family maturation protein NosD [Chrysiogenetes bacterium]
MSRGKLLVAAASGLLGLFNIVVGALHAQSQPIGARHPADKGGARSACRTIQSRQDLQSAIDAAPEGERLCLASGTFQGAFRISKSLTISGPRDAVIHNPDRGSTFFIKADNVVLDGFTITGSGQDYVAQDAGIFVSESNDVKIQNLVIEDVLFGITSQKVNHLSIEDTSIVCRGKRALGMRGDGIRLWETRKSLISGNRLDQCRDMVVWYSPENIIRDNQVSNGRYGTHFMYSSRNVIRDNHFVGNVVGVFVMYSRNLLIRNNLFADAAGAAGMGLGLKESGNLEVVGNRYIHNSVGIYLDNSPLYQDDRNLFAHNEVRLGDIGITFHSSPHQNEFVANTLKDNLRLISIEGGGDALGVEWTRNYYDLYEGYDFDGDGIGDVPFELRSVVDALVNRYPQLKLFAGSLAMFLLETSSRLVPMYQPELLMKDEQPLIKQADRSGSAPTVKSILDRRGIFALEGDAGALNAEQAQSSSEEEHSKY